jgi:hypothetical protein
LLWSLCFAGFACWLACKGALSRVLDDYANRSVGVDGVEVMQLNDGLGVGVLTREWVDNCL